MSGPVGFPEPKVEQERFVAMIYYHVGVTAIMRPAWQQIPYWNLYAQIEAHLSVSSWQARSAISLNVNHYRPSRNFDAKPANVTDTHEISFFRYLGDTSTIVARTKKIKGKTDEVRGQSGHYADTILLIHFSLPLHD